MTKSSGQMSATVNLSGNTQVELVGDYCTVWVGYGLPSYEGTIDGLQNAMPEKFKELVKTNSIKLK